MFMFQIGAQRQANQQEFSTKVFSGMDAQRLLKAVGPACEQMLLKVHGV